MSLELGSIILGIIISLLGYLGYKSLGRSSGVAVDDTARKENRDALLEEIEKIIKEVKDLKIEKDKKVKEAKNASDEDVEKFYSTKLGDDK